VGKALAAGAGEAPPKLLVPLLESLRHGKPPSSTVSRLAPLTRSSDAETAAAAKRLMERITEAGQKTLQQAGPLVKTNPLEAFLLLERLPVVFKDSLVAVKANDQLTRLKLTKPVQTELRARPALASIRKLDTELSSKPGSFDPRQSGFREDNAALLQKLQDAAQQMKKAWPAARATEQAVSIAERYGLTVR
jgi:hypothetical protein